MASVGWQWPRSPWRPCRVLVVVHRSDRGQQRLDSPCADVDDGRGHRNSAAPRPCSSAVPWLAGRAGVDARHVESGSRRPRRRGAETRSSQVSKRRPRRCTWSTTQVPPPGDGPNPGLARVGSGDGARALVYAQGDKQGTGHRGRSAHGGQTSFTVDGFDVTPRYSRPQGQARARWRKSDDVDSRAPLRRVDLTGKPHLPSASEFNAAYLSMLLARNWFWARSQVWHSWATTDRLGNRLPIAAAGSCQPTRGRPRVALASCYGSDVARRLWLVGFYGSAPPALTAPITR